MESDDRKVRPKLRVAILGATGAVGQRFVHLLSSHPWFEITALGASSRSSGKTYGEAVNWLSATPLPKACGEIVLYECCVSYFDNCDLVFSALDSSVADDIERVFSEKGFPVFSNSRNHRLDKLVPILIPYVNPDHLDIVKHQPCYEKSGGFIVTNANCASTGLCIALKPLQDFKALDTVFVSTLQAVSGAGYPGVPSMDMIDNIIPYIDGEESKMKEEPKKILGQACGSEGISNAQLCIVPMCHRVPVTDGHTLSVAVNIAASAEDVKHMFRRHTLSAEVQALPSCPQHHLEVTNRFDRPQPRLDRDAGNGMTVTIGNFREALPSYSCFTVLSHNTVIGAAGGSVLNAELAVSRGLVKHRSKTEALVV